MTRISWTLLLVLSTTCRLFLLGGASPHGVVKPDQQLLAPAKDMMEEHPFESQQNSNDHNQKDSSVRAFLRAMTRGRRRLVLADCESDCDTDDDVRAMDCCALLYR